MMPAMMQFGTTSSVPYCRMRMNAQAAERASSTPQKTIHVREVTVAKNRLAGKSESTKTAPCTMPGSARPARSLGSGSYSSPSRTEITMPQAAGRMNESIRASKTSRLAMISCHCSESHTISASAVLNNFHAEVLSERQTAASSPSAKSACPMVQRLCQDSL